MRTYSTHKLVTHNSRPPLAKLPPSHSSLKPRQSADVRIKYDRPCDREIIVKLDDVNEDLENLVGEPNFRAEKVSWLFI